MIIYEYICPRHGLIEKKFANFHEAEPFIEETLCGNSGTCEVLAKRILSPTQVIFYGTGWTTPGASASPSYTRADPTKHLSDFNVVNDQTGQKVGKKDVDDRAKAAIRASKTKELQKRTKK